MAGMSYGWPPGQQMRPGTGMQPNGAGMQQMGVGRPQMPVMGGSMGGVQPPTGPQIPVVPQRPSPRYGPSYPGPSPSPMGGSFPGMRPGSLGGSATASPVPGSTGGPRSTPPAPGGNVRGLSPGPGVIQHTRPFYEPNTTVEYYSPTFQKWIPAVVLAYSEEDGTYHLDVKQYAPVDRIRACQDSPERTLLVAPQQATGSANFMPEPRSERFMPEPRGADAKPMAATAPIPVQALPRSQVQQLEHRAELQLRGHLEEERMRQDSQEVNALMAENQQLRQQLEALKRKYYQDLAEARAREDALAAALRAEKPMPNGVSAPRQTRHVAPAYAPAYSPPRQTAPLPSKSSGWTFTWGGDEILEVAD